MAPVLGLDRKEIDGGRNRLGAPAPLSSVF